MRLVAPLRLRIEKDTIVRIHRILKGKGVINVSQGQEVSPSDIIGTASVSPGFRTLNLAQALSVSADKVEKYMQRSLGQKIFKGELLAYKNNLFGAKKVVTSPADGILDFINSKTGEIRMAFLPKKEDLPAGVYGIVEKVDKQKGEAIIRTQVSKIYGVSGSGRLRDGILHIVGKRDEMMTASSISPKYDREILVGGSIVSKEAITAAISAGINGIIIGGINAQDYKSMAGGKLIFPKKLENDIGISIAICEGFGSVSIGEDIYQILAEYDGKFVLIDGNKGLIQLPSFESKSMARIKSTSLGPIKDGELITYEDSNQLLEVRAGLKVRIIGNSFLGEQGIILTLDKSESLLPSAVKTLMVTVETKRRKIKVPVANLEVIL